MKSSLMGNLVAAIVILSCSNLVAASLSITDAQSIATQDDAGINQTLFDASAAREEAVANAQLPDPVLMFGIQNLPTDTFEFDQEPMSQLKIGIKQMFPPGDSLSLNEKKSTRKADSIEEMARVRVLEIERKVRKLWLEIYYWEQATNILRQDESLFQQLLTVTHSLYSVGKVQQQDVLRAELELSRLKQKVIKSSREGESQKASLSRWIGNTAFAASWPSQLPVLITPALVQTRLKHGIDINKKVWSSLVSHPSLISLDKRIEVADLDVQLTEQQYQPAWGLELNYGYRDGENSNGSERSDFVSAMVNVSVPLFAKNRQDRKVQSASYQKSAVQESYDDLLEQMAGDIQTLIRRLQQTEAQLVLFDQEILNKASQHAEAALNAYQADSADFSEVMRAYIGEQKDRLDYERLAVTRLQLISELQFYFPDQKTNSSIISEGAQQ